MAVLLEGHVLHHRGQLVVVSYQDDALQPAVAILLPLQPYKFIGSAVTAHPESETCFGLGALAGGGKLVVIAANRS